MQILKDFVVFPILQEIVVVVFGVLIANFIKHVWDKKKYGGWKVKILKKDEELLAKEISPSKAKQIIEIPEDKQVFLKGWVSAYERLNCDLLEDGPKLGLYEEDKKGKLIVIHLEKNPLPQKEEKSEVF